ncbi:MAG: serine/threonine-protein phosphatase [Prevotella sp.]|uniref:Protein phosphatase n=1 Tax=Xylanibacter ruminicola TaxID=839 RepID=A0A1M7NTA5_XYLRU|nr:protein phosphatase 2C domain-containing protein [Xylanibacter ruminicola]MBP3247918.1 serine/threonine-protein phosphatase [Prevotella sp.]MBQ3312459.1 serine/threonine-protein phosphatase [Prevotella sp.]MBQ6054349.1 serine/threonine-protein phosphatase [Prevotella sp.]MBQ6918275.1 serine/threonine-protein phosphatase [Prevotella sp.]MBR0187909.1 serine/threonine-protein phosphatase [Prevotella sp.]
MITIHMTAASKVGCVRSQNEDMVLLGSHFVRNDAFSTRVDLTNSDRYIMAVADGMGGHNRGDVASSDALHNLEFYFHDLPTGLSPESIKDKFEDWLDSINNIIDSKGRSDEQYKGMGTTLVGLAFYEGQFYTLNCGDSRLYRFRDGDLTQLTSDHSLSNMLGSSQHSNVITNCIGGGATSSFIDIVNITDDIKEGDVYMLCSDGLTDMLPDSIIYTLLAEGSDANTLCDAAVAAGGLDNVSCCVLQF